MKLTDAEAEAFLRYLTATEKKNLLMEAIAKTLYAKDLFAQWKRYLQLRKEGLR